MSKKIGLYGGSFDPIHLGHLHLACELQEAHQLDEVWFVPAAHSPHKDPALASPAHRVAMVKVAIEAFPSFRVLTEEIDRGGLSYTIDTVRAIKEKIGTSSDVQQLFLMVGEDAVAGLHRWYAVHQLIEEVRILVGKRFRSEQFPVIPDLSLYEKVKPGFTDIPIFEVDSTMIRKKLFEKGNCAHLILPKVLDYIQENQLYC